MLPQQKIEEILQAIWNADERSFFTLKAIRSQCPEEISEEEISEMEKEGLVIRQGDHILFSPEGKTRAKEVVRRYRLTLSLLTHVLKIEMEKAEQIACDMEHILPAEMTQSICTLLGHPEVAPDGRPIPPGDDCVRRERSAHAIIVNLCELEPGEQGRIAYIKPKDHSRSHRLAAFGVVPGVLIELHQKHPAYCIKFEGTELAISQDVAEDIFVGRIRNSESSESA